MLARTTNTEARLSLNGDGLPEFQVCCHGAPHGPCGAVLIDKVGNE